MLPLSCFLFGQISVINKDESFHIKMPKSAIAFPTSYKRIPNVKVFFFLFLSAVPYCLRNLSLGIDVDYNSEKSARNATHWTLQYTDTMGETRHLHFSLCQYPGKDYQRARLRVLLVTSSRNSIQSNKKRNLLKILFTYF